MINESAAWCGLDISKDTFDAAFHPPGNHIEFSSIPSKSFPRTKAGMLAFYEWVEMERNFDDYPIRVIMEATGRYSLETAAWIMDDHPEYRPAIVNPRHAAAFNASLGLRNKTDKIDSRALAKMGIERNPPAYQPLTPLRQELQALTRLRTSYVEERTAAKNRKKECPDVPFVKKLQDKHHAHLDKVIDLIEKELVRLIQKDKGVLRDMKLLQTIPGVGFITAITTIAELGDLSAFRCSRKIAAMVGVSPQNHTSGTSVHKRARMSKQGSVHVRAVLYMAARTAAIHNPQMSAFYQRLKENGKSHNCALGAVMRKLIVLMRSLIIGQNAYDPNWDHNTRVTRPVEKRSENY